MTLKRLHNFLRHLVLATALLSVCHSVSAQQHGRAPIAVGIMIEGLTDEYLTLLEQQFTDGGFRRLMNNGVYISDVRFGPAIDPTAAAAILMTGTSPNVNGIPAAYTYQQSTKRATPVLTDSKSLGNFTDETLSPKTLKVSTITDELRIATDGDGSVYSIAADPQLSILGAGHAANGAYWIYDHTGNWASTTFYKEMPSVVTNRNHRSPLRSRLDTITWRPALPMAAYPLLSKNERSKPFRHTYPAKDFDRFTKFKSTPMANTEATDLALDLISSAKMGRDDATDMIVITYKLNAPGASQAEIMDLYIRLDRDLNRLFNAIYKASGTVAPIIFVAGLPSTSPYKSDDAKWKVPAGEYSIRKALSLLEMYLIGVHGNGDWVDGYHNHHFYLNRKLIVDKGLNLADFRTEAADFLARMAGVSNVYTIDDIIAARVGDDPQGLKRNTSVEISGDVIVEITPGWTIVDDPNSKSSSPTAERQCPENIPAFILSPLIRPNRISSPIDARAIAPAVCKQLRVRSPNAAANGSLKLN